MRSPENISGSGAETTANPRHADGSWLRWPLRMGSALRATCARTFRSPTAVAPDTILKDLEPGSVSDRELQSLVDEMLSQSRYALLMRPQLIANLSVEQFARTRAALSENMCMVPEGEVVLRHGPATLPLGDSLEDTPSLPVRVESYYLDRYPVTNAQYQSFVANGGYEQMAIWAPEIWPAVLDFVDETGHPGPRYWRQGRFPRGEERHPVVGLSWYEASAYARWTGKRLPTDAEWVKAASWPVALSGHPLIQRRYPWGEAMDRGRANLWGSGPGRTASVDEFNGGVSVGGAQQLIGNVWEWTADLLSFDEAEPNQHNRGSIRSVRGGAFDTYLDCQATCHFQSGDRALARKHNVGFRCAISVCDLATLEEHHAQDVPQSEETLLEETHA
jgi:iron(II)-dependent oxidoreductase